MFRRWSLSLSLHPRERSTRRVTMGFSAEEKLKLSKIPLEMISFNDISRLPHRQLAYTTHMAGRLGLDNEDLWIQLRDAFLDSFENMKPKLVTQCIVSLGKRETLLSDRDKKSIIQLVAQRVSEFRLVDIIMVLHALGGNNDRQTCFPANTVNFIWSHILSILPSSSLEKKTIAILFACAGKMGGNVLIPSLMNESRKFIQLFDEYELAAIIRSCAAIGDFHCESFVADLLEKNSAKLSPGCANIVLHALAKGTFPIREKTRENIFNRVSRSMVMGSDIVLVPHILASCCRLAVSENEKNYCVKLARTVERHLKQLKIASLPTAMEGFQELRQRFPADRDVKVVCDSIERITHSLVDQFITIASEDEKSKLIESYRTTAWFRNKLLMERQPENADQGENETHESVESVMEQVWQTNGSLDEIETMAAKSSSLSDYFYSMYFRYTMKHQKDIGTCVEEKFLKDIHVCDIKTVLRGIQAGLVRDGVIDQLLQRFKEVSSDDILGCLRLLKKCNVELENNLHADAVEAKIAIELELVKSLSKRNDIIRAANAIGLSQPEDLIDEFEAALAADRMARLGKPS